MNLNNRTFKQETVVVALNRLFTNSFFDITTLNKTALVAEVIIPVEQQRILDALHCVYYNTMTKEFREDLAEMIQNLFKDFFEVESHRIKFREIIKEFDKVKA